MAKRGDRRPASRTVPAETNFAGTNGEHGNGNGNGNANSKARFGLGAAALTWRDRIAALGVERRAKEVAFLDAAIADRKKQLAKLKESMAELEDDLRDRTPLRNEIELLRSQRSNLETELEELARHRQELQAAPGELIQAKAELDQLRAEIALARAERDELDRVRTERAFEVQDLREQAAAHERAVCSAAEELEKLNRHIDRARAECEASTSEEKEQVEQLETVRTQVRLNEAAHATLQRQIDAAREVLAGLARERGELEATTAELASKRRKMDEEAGEQEILRRDRQANLSRLDEEILALHHSLGAARLAADAELEQFAQAKAEREQTIEAVEAELCQQRQRKAAEAQLLETLAQEQEEARCGLAQLDATIAQRTSELDELKRRKTGLEAEIDGVAADQAEQQRQRRLCLEELANVRRHLTEAGARLVTLRDLVEEREHDLSAIRGAVQSAQDEHQIALSLRQEELADADLRIRQSCEILAGITADLESRQADLQTLQTAVATETERLATSQRELQAHLLRKETQLRLLEAKLASARDNLQTFLAERDQRQQEAQSRLAQVLTKRKVAEDDLAAKIQELERVNTALAEAGDAQMALARTLVEIAKAQAELTEQERQLRLHEEENLAAEAKLAGLRHQAAMLEGVDAQVSARQEELREFEDRIHLLETRSRLLGPAASLEIGTILVLASDLIGGLDLLDARIGDFRRFACDHDFAAELERVRQSFLEVLGRHGIVREDAPEAGTLPRYRHQGPDGTETVLRVTGRS